MKAIALVNLLLGAAVLSLRGATPEWPGFRGPNSSGVAPGAKPPLRIGPTNSVAWKIPLPFSPSCPVIAGDRLFVTAFADGELQTRCYQRRDGKLAWAQGIKVGKLETFHRTESSPAASTPVTDGDLVVSYFGSFGLVCYDLQGNERWRHPLPMALSLGGYGTGTCPLIAGNLVVLSHDQDEASSLLALDLQSGRRVWETPRPDAYGSFGTPILWQNDGVAEVVVPGSLRLKGYALKSGEEDWRVEGLTPFVCTSPVAGDGLLFFAAWSDGKADAPWPTWEKFQQEHDKNKDGVISLLEFDDGTRDYFRGYDANRDGQIDKTDWDRLQSALGKGENLMVAIKPGGRGNITQSHVAWKATRGLPYVASPLCYEGRVYLVKTGGMISSLDSRTGKPFYLQERLEAPGEYYASPVAAAGQIYVASVSGKVTVLKAGGEKPEILHQADFGERIHSTPALAGANLYLRTQSALYAFTRETAP